MAWPTVDVAARKAGYERLRDDLLRIQQRIADIEVTAESPDGLVSATVVKRGELTELRLDPRVYRSPDSKALAKAIVATIQDAVEQAREKLFDITRDYLPSDAKFDETDVDTGPFMHQLDKQIEGA
ncbi:YbaB/EbfC family nucleoid-associated protein [Amycolatopsis anabasis]|uniref:YbaB/EbfC family nucleoid-associated protein n=1 Tax=Amycolatopsis anabasis TaxID=1840409 RepID=UPI00131B0C77|nr:YbaB/EbfC family nucleoid-associated protein [Amycolatopsis anabasis]